MGLIQAFDEANDKEWEIVNVLLPHGANVRHVRNELEFMAEDFVTQIGFSDDEDNALKLGFRSEDMRDQVLEHLQGVIEQSIGMSDRSTFVRRWANEQSRHEIQYCETSRKRHGYVSTITPAGCE